MKKLFTLAIVLTMLLSVVPAFGLELQSGADMYPIQTDKKVVWYAEGNINPHEKFASYEESPFHLGLAEMTGIDVEFMFPPAGTAGNVFTNTLMADPANLPDIMWGPYMTDAQLYIEDEVIWDLTPYIEEYAPAYYAFLKSNEAYDRAMKTDNGQYYAFGFFREDGGWNDTYLGPVVRTDWLEEAGLEIPTTISEFENVIRVFNEKYGAKLSFANNRVNTTGLSGAFGAFGQESLQYFVKDGKVGLAQAQPEWRAYVAWLNKLWNDGLLDQDFLALDDTSIKGKIHNDMTGISITSMGQLNNWNKERVAESKDGVWVGIPYPTGDDGTLSMVFGGAGIGTSVAMITKSADEDTMKVALQLLNYAYTKEGFNYWNFGKEGVSWEMGADGQPQLTALVTDDKDTDPLVKYGGATWSGPCIQATRLLYMKNSDVAIDANDTWFYPNEAVSAYWKWPVGANFTVEESDELKIVGTSLGTFVPESFGRFVTGASDINSDAAWEEYLKTLDSYDLQRVLEIRQACYDRYLAR